MSSTIAGRLCWSSLLLLVFYACGVFVFVNLEREAELRTYAENRELYENMKGMYSFEHCADSAFQGLTFCRSQAEFTDSLRVYFNQHGNSVEDLEQWTVLGSMFFLTHLTTTIGYGGSHPQTPLGQLATIVFALLGIPIMGYMLAQVAWLDLRAVVFILERWCGVEAKVVRRQQVLILWCLLTVLLFGGSFVYSRLEPWSYLESLYFCFVTLSTVGFGDFLPSCAASKVFSIFYMIFGLGVCASIIAVLVGLVAEGHDRSDTYLTKRIQESCPDCCIGSADSP